MARVLVTGGTGFIGSRLAARLSRDGHDVIITGNRTENPAQVKVFEPALHGLDWFRMGAFDVVFHQAANNDTTCTDEDEMMHANLYASVGLFNNLFEKGCKHFIFASSCAVYGDGPAPYVEDQALKPLNVYGKSKVKLEEYALRWAEMQHVHMVGLRYSNVYGPGEVHKGKRASMVYQLIQSSVRGEAPRLFKWGEQRRDFVHVDDVVEANIAAWKRADQGFIQDIFNVGSGQSESFANVAHFVQNAFGKVITPKWIDNPHAESYQNFTQCDMRKAEARLAFKPQIAIPDGVQEYAKLFK